MYPENEGLLKNYDLSHAWPQEEGMVPPSSNYEIYRYRFPEYLGDLNWIEAAKVIVRLGILAPSSHNMQPWKFELNPVRKEMRVIPDMNFAGGPSDETGREAVISLGTCTENIMLGLSAYGLKPEVSLLPFQAQGKDLVGVTFNLENINAGKLVNQEIIDIMRLRRVYRGPFNREAAADLKVYQQMVDLVNKPGLKLVLKGDRATKTALGIVQYAADNVVLQNGAFRSELGQFMAANDTEQTRVMPGSTFGLNDRDAAQVQDELAAGGLLRGAFAAGFPQADKDAIFSAQAIGLIVVEKSDAEHWFKAGRAMQDVWLYAQSQGLGIGVMAGMVEVAAKGREVLSKLGIKGNLAVVMRMGVPRNGTWPRSPRVSIEDVVSVIE